MRNLCPLFSLESFVAVSFHVLFGLGSVNRAEVRNRSTASEGNINDSVVNNQLFERLTGNHFTLCLHSSCVCDSQASVS